MGMKERTAMREIRARLREMCSNSLFPAAVVLYTLFILFMLFQKAINRGSGYYQPELVTPYYMAAYAPVLLCATGRPLMCVTAALLAARPAESNTAAHYLLRGGRRLYIRSMLAAQFTVAAAAAVGYTVLLVLCGALIRPQADHVCLPDMLLWLGTAVLFNCYNSMTALLVAFVSSGTVAAIVTSLLLPTGISILGRLSPAISVLSGSRQRSALLAGVYRILGERGDTQITCHMPADTGVWGGVLYLAGWILLVSCLLYLAGQKKEYPS